MDDMKNQMDEVNDIMNRNYDVGMEEYEIDQELEEVENQIFMQSLEKPVVESNSMGQNVNVEPQMPMESNLLKF